jgi:hypothetical protein
MIGDPLTFACDFAEIGGGATVTEQSRLQIRRRSP